MEPVFSPELWGDQLVDSHIWNPTGTGLPAGIVTELANSLTGDFTAIGWYNNLTTENLPCNIWDVGVALARFKEVGSSYVLEIDVVSSQVDFPVTWDGTTWECFFIIRDGLNLRIYEGTTLIGSTVLLGDLDLGTNVRCISTTCTVGELKVLPRVLTEADMSFYYNNVLNSKGDVVLPNF